MLFNLPWPDNVWQKKLSEAVSDPQELFRLLNLPKEHLPSSLVTKDFKLRVPHGFIARMQKGNLHDPLLMQIMPSDQELISPLDYLLDPLKEQAKNQLPGLLHKYKNRVLLFPSGVCAVHCRYCFRRHFNYAENRLNHEGWKRVVDYICNHKEVNEVILSGGDPLTVNDHYLAECIQRIVDIPQIQRLRFHTRFPVVLPERITKGFIKALQTRLKTVIVIHVNHPNEIDFSLKAAMSALKNAGIMLFNQSVLLKGINDCSATLITLSEKLFEAGVIPYYLHLLDKVQGVSHFEVHRKKAKQIMRILISELPGYLVPKLVVEEAGKAGKTVVV
jgi:L-lysine 2,3-aminomutase